jgi:hypothetical protein
VVQVFREEVNGSNLLFNQDQINTSKRLVNYYGDKKDIFYMFSFKYVSEWYAKYGIDIIKEEMIKIAGELVN